MRTTLALLFASAVAMNGVAFAQTPTNAALKIVVISGEDAVNIIQQKTAVAPVIEVRDRNNLPVSGATVTFAVSGNGATFAGGAQTLTVKLDTLEARVHNPRAEVVYDILAQRGGTKIYSRLAPLYTSVIEADGAPTQGMREVYATLKKELDAADAEFRTLVSGDLAALNRSARELNFGDVLVPAARPGR